MSGGSGEGFYWRVATGQVRDHNAVNKFGRAPSGMQTTVTDVWDRADATPTQQVHTVPTAPRIHNITSSSINDDLGNTGAEYVKIWGITSWETEQDNNEESEVVEMNGTANVATQNAYVFIHRIRVIQAGSNGNNVGTITATAQTDGTVSAAIRPGNGTTQMAMLGVPAGWQFWLSNLQVAVSRAAGAAATINFDIMDDDYTGSTDAGGTVLKASNVRDEISVQSTGSSTVIEPYQLPLRFTGPCVIRISGIASAADTDAIATFQGITTRKKYNAPTALGE